VVLAFGLRVSCSLASNLTMHSDQDNDLFAGLTDFCLVAKVVCEGFSELMVFIVIIVNYEQGIVSKHVPVW
jgi:hypothetical protein